MNGHQSMKTITRTGLDTHHIPANTKKQATKVTHERFLSELVIPGQEHLTDKSEILLLVFLSDAKSFSTLAYCLAVGPCLQAMIWSLSSIVKKSSAEMNARHYRLCHQNWKFFSRENSLPSNYEPLYYETCPKNLYRISFFFICLKKG